MWRANSNQNWALPSLHSSSSLFKVIENHTLVVLLAFCAHRRVFFTSQKHFGLYVRIHSVCRPRIEKCGVEECLKSAVSDALRWTDHCTRSRRALWGISHIHDQSAPWQDSSLACSECTTCCYWIVRNPRQVQPFLYTPLFLQRLLACS